MKMADRPHWKDIRLWVQAQQSHQHSLQCRIGDYALPLRVEGMRGACLEVSVQARACPCSSQPLDSLPDDAPVMFTFVDDELQFIGFRSEGAQAHIGLTWAS